MFNSDIPFAFLGLPFRLLHSLSRAKVLVHIVLPCNTLPVLFDLLSLGEFFRPLGIWRDAGLIYMCRDIAANAGICILEPVRYGLATLSHKRQGQNGECTMCLPKECG